MPTKEIEHATSALPLHTRALDAPFMDIDRNGLAA
jgi:hypothetical protein